MASQPVRVPDEVHEEVQNAARLLGCTSGELLARAWLAYRQSPEFREEFCFFQKAFAKGDIDAITQRLRSQAADRAAASRTRAAEAQLRPALARDPAKKPATSTGSLP